MAINGKPLARALVAVVKDKEGKALDEAVRVFLEAVRESGQGKKIKAMLRSMDAVWKETFGAANVHVVSAHSLTARARQHLLEAASGADVQEEVDPSLIAGARVRVDDRVIDATTAGHLASLKRFLLS